MNKLGNKIQWFKPLKLIERNKQLEKETEELYIKNNEEKETNKLTNMVMQESLRENKINLETIKKDKKEKLWLKSIIYSISKLIKDKKIQTILNKNANEYIDLEKNLDVLIETNKKVVEICNKYKTSKVSKEILNELGGNIYE